MLILPIQEHGISLHLFVSSLIYFIINRHLRVSVLRSDRTGLKEQLVRELWLTEAVWREGYGLRGEPVAAEACVTLHQPEACHVFSQGICP